MNDIAYIYMSTLLLNSFKIYTLYTGARMEKKGGKLSMQQRANRRRKEAAGRKTALNLCKAESHHKAVILYLNIDGWSRSKHNAL